MERLTTFEIHADVGLLKNAYGSGAPVEYLDPPLRSVVSGIVSRAQAEPLSIYLCSPEHDAEARDLFGFVLAKWIREHVPTALLVDCDFLSTGMSGIVPHRDALGFLDLLLYGTSLGVITQEAHAGVAVVGAGSFPVTKKSPFAMDAFDNTRRYLVNQARCVVYCGPALDDDDQVHPIVEHVDLAVLVRTGTRFRDGSLDKLEQLIASSRGEAAWSVRINTSPPAPAEKDRQAPVAETTDMVVEDEEPRKPEPKKEPVRKPAKEPTKEPKVPEAKERLVPPSPRESEDARVPVFEKRAVEKEHVVFATEGADGRRAEDETGTRNIAGPTLERKTRGSRWLRIVTSVVGIFLIGIVLWWLYLTKSVREREQDTADMAAGTVVTEEESGAGAAADSTGTRVFDEEASGTGEVEPATQIVSDEPSARETGTREAESAPERREVRRDPDARYVDGILLAEKLDAFADKYLVHVSSFRRLENAKEESLYLVGWGYPVFIYRVDLGGKGIWYRVYVGPSETREEAREHKIKLDENPRIQSTRISRVPG